MTRDYSRELLPVCVALHGARTGAHDHGGAEGIRIDIAFVCVRLMQWEASTDPFDLLVKELAEQAVVDGIIALGGPTSEKKALP